MKIVIAGGSGFIGGAVVRQLLQEKHIVVLLTRNPEAVKQSVGGLLIKEYWDGKNLGTWTKQVNGADAVINLAGESIASGRWTKKRKANIIGSRINATRAIINAIAAAQTKPRVLINASAVGYYGNVIEGEVTEEHPRGQGFLSDTCSEWEHEAGEVEKYGLRLVILRFGVVLAQDGGALRKMLLPFKLFVGGPLGSGRQWFPWIHCDDIIGIISFALHNPKLSGPVNAVAPELVTMKQFCAALGKAISRPSWAPVPAFILKTILGEMSEMMLEGQRVIPAKLKAAGYVFRYPLLINALEDIFKKE
jgi:uncharacterized protein